MGRLSRLERVLRGHRGRRRRGRGLTRALFFRRIAAAIGAVLAALSVAPAIAAPIACIDEGRPAMGTLLQLRLCGEDPAALRTLARAAFAEVEREEAIFSTYRTDSDVTRLNRVAGTGPARVSADLHRILRDARHYHDLTRKTFDVTVGPLMALWQSSPRTPSDADVEQALARVGQDKVVLREDETVDLTRPEMAIDLGGIAKGWALDRVRESWTDHPELASALLEFGQSSVWAIGSPPDAPAWNLALRSPDGEPLAALSLRDVALSVSATFGSSHETEGHRFGHVVDPRTGRALERDRVAAVVAADATAAEAFSKAVLILAEDGIALIEDIPGAEAILFEPGRATLRTSGWDRLVAPRAADQGARGGAERAVKP